MILTSKETIQELTWAEYYIEKERIQFENVHLIPTNAAPFQLFGDFQSPNIPYKPTIVTWVGCIGCIRYEHSNSSAES